MRNVNVRYDRRDPTAQQAVANADKRRTERCGRCKHYSNLDWNCAGICPHTDKPVFVGSRACERFSRR